ncbi:MAG: hypothetical protein ACI4N5_02015 [Christensenellales bacterium]|jgi:uncharacterized protein YpuA (DUF1002 family)
MDIKNLSFDGLVGKAEELAKKIGADKQLLASFTREPVKTLEAKLGIDLPDEQLNKLADAIKAKLNLDKAGDMLGGIGKLFG